MKKLLILFCIASVFVSAQSFAQEEQDSPQEKNGFDPSRLFFGGNFGVSFGDYTFVNVSPLVGYRFNKYLAAGTGINFIYSDYKYRYTTGQEYYRDQYGYAGLSIFGRVYPIQFIFLQVQPEYNYSWGKRKYSNPPLPEEKLEGKFVPSLLLGAGAAIPTGARGAFIVSVQYDVIQDVRSPYGSNAFFSVGYNF
jgi:hypothetical protein